MTDPYDVIIVGGGPVGLGAALELGQRGVRCVLVEKETAEHLLPKGQSLTNRTLEHFYFWGCVDALRQARKLEKGFPIGNVTLYRDLTSPYWYYQAGGGPGRGATVASLFYQRAERLPQYDTERVMRARLSELDTVTLMRGRRVTQVSEESDRVEAIVDDVSGGGAATLFGRYLIGADGARSLVRTQAGIGSTDRRLGDRMVLMVFRSPELEAQVARLPDTTTLRILKPELKGHWQFFGRVDARDTWFFHAPVPSGATLEEADLLALLHDAAGFPFAAEIQHAGFWDLRITIADEYRRGRIFIAGDACHGHPPYGGFGLNTGLEDARNLGWKLAAVLQGWGGEALLDSYGAERRPVFAQTAEHMIANAIEREREFLEAFDLAKDKAAFEAAWSTPPTEFWAAHYLPHYAGSPTVTGGEGRSPGIDGRATLEAEPGQHLAPASLSDGRNVFEVLGQGFHLLALDASDAARAFQDAAAAVGVPLGVTRDSFAESRALYGKRLVLVRPDEHVAWAGDEPPTDIRGLLRRAAGLAPAA